MSATANYTKLGQITYQAEVRYRDGDYPSVHHPALPQPQEFPGKDAAKAWVARQLRRLGLPERGCFYGEVQRGRYPSRKTQGLARYYLTGRLRQAAPPALPGELERLKREVAALRAALELLTTCQHGHGLDCPRCEPVPDLVRQALAGEAVRPA